MSTIARTDFADGRPRPYAATASAGGLVFACGQVPTGPDGAIAAALSEQVSQALDNLEDVLRGAGSDLDHLLKLTVFLADLAEFDEYNAAYLRRLEGHPLPPRTTVAVAGFRGDKRIEIDAIAALA